MPALLIKDISPALHRKLKRLARREHRSMNQQALTLLEEGLNRPAPPALLPPFKGPFPLTKEFVDRAKRAGRS